MFLDDVTVSRDHALLVRRGDDWYLDDLGSLNGTYVNRPRIESHRLEDGDELQIGKYKLTYLHDERHDGHPHPGPRRSSCRDVAGARAAGRAARSR